MPAKRVLFYDDIKKEVQSVADRLEEVGVKVDVVDRFSDARQIALKKKYDVVVFDLRLDNEQDTDGLQFLTAAYDQAGSVQYVIFSRWVDEFQDRVDSLIAEGQVKTCFGKNQVQQLLEYLLQLLGLAPGGNDLPGGKGSLLLQEEFQGEVTRVIGDDVEVIFDVEGDTVEHVYNRDQLEGAHLPDVGDKVAAISFLFTRPAPPLDVSKLKEALRDDYPAIKKRIDRRKIIQPED
ncbi:response regulator transcription factor [bacterium]|nr:response regulator transcription factor [bacterium]